MQYHPLFRDKIDQLGDQVLSNAVANGDIFTVPHRLLLMSTWVPGFDPKAVRSYVLQGRTLELLERAQGEKRFYCQISYLTPQLIAEFIVTDRVHELLDLVEKLDRQAKLCEFLYYGWQAHNPSLGGCLSWRKVAFLAFQGTPYNSRDLGVFSSAPVGLSSRETGPLRQVDHLSSGDANRTQEPISAEPTDDAPLADLISAASGGREHSGRASDSSRTPTDAELQFTILREFRLEE